MPDLARILALLGATSVAHPYGHVQTGHDVREPVTIDWKRRVEDWDNTGNPEKEAKLHAGGFTFQDRLASAMDDTELGSDARTANMLYKLGYLSGATLPRGTKGDISGMEKNNNPHAKSMMLSSAALDALKSIFHDVPVSPRLDVADNGTLMQMFDFKF
jgi:hypothetical protein